MNKLGAFLLVLVLICIAAGCTGCKGDRYTSEEEGTGKENQNIENSQDTVTVVIPNKIAKAIFFIENSESMFGYVKGNTNYVKVLSELSEKPMFVVDQTKREFNFINGGDNLSITPIGDTAEELSDKLNIRGYTCGDPTKSNLNSMFQIALEKAREDTITILISDAIYDIGNSQDPLLDLTKKGNATRTKFIERLTTGGVQTIMIKLLSEFNGNYFPVSGGKIKINQVRPFYIWIFGDTDLLNKYFPEEYVSSLKGYSDMARFLKFDDFEIPFQATAQMPRTGRFRFDKRDKNKLIDVEADNYGEGFKFTFATDFSKLPYSDSYLENINNYSCTNNYSVRNVSKVSERIHSVYKFDPTHLITVSNSQSPYGTLKVSLNNVVPNWIHETSAEDDSNIVNDTTSTIGFDILTKAITDAYTYITGDNNITEFTFTITN